MSSPIIDFKLTFAVETEAAASVYQRHFRGEKMVEIKRVPTKEIKSADVLVLPLACTMGLLLETSAHKDLIRFVAAFLGSVFLLSRRTFWDRLSRFAPGPKIRVSVA
jgi:hypothetical protein